MCVCVLAVKLGNGQALGIRRNAGSIIISTFRISYNDYDNKKKVVIISNNDRIECEE